MIESIRLSELTPERNDQLTRSKTPDDCGDEDCSIVSIEQTQMMWWRSWYSKNACLCKQEAQGWCIAALPATLHMLLRAVQTAAAARIIRAQRLRPTYNCRVNWFLGEISKCDPTTTTCFYHLTILIILINNEFGLGSPTRMSTDFYKAEISHIMGEMIRIIDRRSNLAQDSDMSIEWPTYGENSICSSTSFQDLP